MMLFLFLLVFALPVGILSGYISAMLVFGGE